MKIMVSKKSKSLTVTNNVDQLSKADIISIIKQCHKSGVKNFKIQGMELTLADDHVAHETFPKLSANALERLHNDDQGIDNEDALGMAEAQLMVEDPEEWERQAATGVFKLDAESPRRSGS
jgi:hypothetical protein